jgi:cytochrome c oxidase subunit 2
MSFHALPVEASSMARDVDVLFYSLLGLSALVVIGITATVIFFSVRYRRGSKAPRGKALNTRRWELAWSLIPLTLFLGVFVWSARLYFNFYNPPADAMPVYIVGKQWMWKVQHPTGQREINELHVPVGQPVKLVMTSEDVIHSFFVPAFRIKQDVVPGTYTTTWFKPSRVGTYPLFCAEYCGTNHSRMGGKVVVMKPAAYREWLRSQPAPERLASTGAKRFREYGCSGCHGENSTVKAPPLEGVFGRTVHLSGGDEVIADETYIRDSILLPRKQVVAGYPPIMPTFKGEVSEEDLLALVAYIKSIGAREREASATDSGEARP